MFNKEISLNFLGKSLKNNGKSKICFQTADIDNLTELYKLIEQLETKYVF